MLLRQMKYFVSVVERGSFTEAAEQCYISQSAMSQQIQALEKDLGVTLLSRGNRRFSLTPAGEYFYRHSKGILAETDTLRRETLRLARRGASRLRIGYLRGYSGLELSQAVADFSRQFPETAIDIVNGAGPSPTNMSTLSCSNAVAARRSPSAALSARNPAWSWRS